jgi:AcrR family transcriptional regulator
VTETSSVARSRLIASAAELIVEVGPRAASVRLVADRAGVNHGLVHHYFGSKDVLLQAAMIQLLEDHREFVNEHAGGDVVPPPMLLLRQRRYIRAVAHCVLDDEMDLAMLEVTEGISIPRAALEFVTASRGESSPSTKVKAAACAAMALEMGWALLEPFLFAVTGVDKSEEEQVRERAAAIRGKLSAVEVRT